MLSTIHILLRKDCFQCIYGDTDPLKTGTNKSVWSTPELLCVLPDLLRTDRRKITQSPDPEDTKLQNKFGLSELQDQ